MRPTSHNLQRRGRQFTQQNCIQWLGLVSILEHFHGLGTCHMLTIIYIYFTFTAGQLTLLIDRSNCIFRENAPCQRGVLGIVKNVWGCVMGKRLDGLNK